MERLRIESSPVGRIVVPSNVPDGYELFWTTADFSGMLDDGGRTALEATLAARKLAPDLATCAQVHGVEVVRAEESGGWRECSACDALWASARPMSIAIKVADCLPVTVIGDSLGIIGGAHAGWRGACDGVVDALLDAVVDIGGAHARDLRVWLGPSIRVCCFEVGDEVVDRFVKRWPDAHRWIDRGIGPRPHIDLAAMTVDRLRRRGVRAEAIFDSELCTRCPDSIFHSYRREGPGRGRNLAIVSRR